jgi:dTDP-4-amino-4,6-dideoxygalactose transaminase
MIPFVKASIVGRELEYIADVLKSSKFSGDGKYTKRCHKVFEDRYGFNKVLLTTSCTDALEMAAILCNIQSGDEVIIPSYTFVSTANAFVLRGAKIVFADSRIDTPHLDENSLESLISDKTKVIVPVHYAGSACDMDKIKEISEKYNLFVIEDAAQAIDSYFKEKPLGSLGTFGTFSFHDTKNITCGEGGLLCINDSQFSQRAEIIREKGTNRSAFIRGEAEKYGWVDLGSSFLPADILSAFLYGQLEWIDAIQNHRRELWNRYHKHLFDLERGEKIIRQKIPKHSTNNAHMYYVLCNSIKDRTFVIEYLKKKNIISSFHYLPLHKSKFFESKHDGRELPNCDRFADTLLRLPLFNDLKVEEVDMICNELYEAFSLL